MTQRASRSVGLAVAGAIGLLPGALLAQHPQPHATEAGLLSAVYRSNISGVVRDAQGQPQIGALVELLNPDFGLVARTFTDDHGRYSLQRLGAGLYQIKASDTPFLPTLRPDLRVLTNARVVVNLTLSTVYQALQWLPAERRSSQTRDDDWDWTLRLSANRPLLRFAGPTSPAGRSAAQGSRAEDEGSQSELVVVQNSNEGSAASHPYHAEIASGPRHFGQGGTSQQTSWRGGDGQTRALLLSEQSSVADAGRISASAGYQQQLSPDRSVTAIATLTDRPGVQAGPASGLRSLRIRSASTVQLGDLADIEAGTELEALTLGAGDTAAASHPFAAVHVHAGQTIISYHVATSPGMTDARHVEGDAADDAPAVSLRAGRLQIEDGLHQELLLQQCLRGWTGELSVFHDRLRAPMVEGLVKGPVKGNEAALDAANVLYDPETGLIAVSGQGYGGGGVMAVLRDQLSRDTWVSLRYALGEAASTQDASLASESLAAPALPTFVARKSSAVSISAQTQFASTGTTVRASYRWQPLNTLTAVAPFSPDAPDAYLGLYLRQPLHPRGGGSKVEAVLDVRNLLAQGYRPFLSQDGSTVYFAQSQRCIAGGLSFSF